MMITMDSSGRLVLPKAIRQEARLTPEIPLEVRYRDGRIEIEPAPRAIRVQRKGRLCVAVPTDGGHRLTAAEVSETQRKLRDGNA